MMYKLNKDGAYERLIETGIKLFGKYGYDAVSIRQISKAAKVNIAAICYHFGGKKKFYEQVVTHLTNNIIEFTQNFDINKFEKLPLSEAKTTLANLIRKYQGNFISEHGINRLNIFMHEAFLQGSAEARRIYTDTIKITHKFYTQILTIYFNKVGKNLDLVNYSIALIHGIIQAYVITNKTISPSEIKLNQKVLEQSIEAVLN